MAEPTPDITVLIGQVAEGRRDARELLPLVYAELRGLAAARLARESPGHTLQATALVHEAFARLLGPGGASLRWDGRGHLFGAAAEAMRRILIDHARVKRALKRGGGEAGPRRTGLAEASLEAAVSLDADPDLLMDLDAALSAFEVEDPSKARLVKLRFYAGLTLEQAAEVLGISPATADRHWAFAKAWLYVRISGGSARDEIRGSR